MTSRNNITGYTLTGLFAAFMTFDGLVRIEELGPVLFACTMAILMGGGLWLRDAPLRSLMPMRRTTAHPSGAEHADLPPIAIPEVPR